MDSQSANSQRDGGQTISSTTNLQRPWYARYPKGVPHEIPIGRFDSVVDVFNRSCQRFRELPSFSNMGKSITFGELDELTLNFAAYLQNHTSLRPGDRIAIQLPNLLQFPVIFYGALRAGLVVVNTNPLYTPREMDHQFRDSGAKAIVILDNFASHLQSIIKNTSIQHVITTQIGDLLGFPKSWVVNAAVRYVKKMVPAYSLPTSVSLPEALQAGRMSSFNPHSVKANDTAILQYTGGTTGISKGARLTHRNLVANMEQIAAWMSPKLREGEEIIITPLPLYHVFSLTVNCMAFLRYGGLNVLITNPRDIPGFVKELKKWKFTTLTGVNTLFNALNNHPSLTREDFKHLKIAVAGGMALQQSVAERWKQMTGVPVIEGYGLTEASPVVSCNPVDGNELAGSIGLPLPSTEIKIISESGESLADGEVGELCVRGPQVMAGYWERPEETQKVITNDGWLRTGDMARFEPDGFLKIMDRKKDMILVSGFNVYPNEIEDVLAAHPGIAEVAAIGVPSEKSGESVKVFVVKKDPGLTAEEVIRFSRAQLAGYKVPQSVEFRDQLPKSNVGKILKRELRPNAE